MWPTALDSPLKVSEAAMGDSGPTPAATVLAAGPPRDCLVLCANPGRGAGCANASLLRKSSCISWAGSLGNSGQLSAANTVGMKSHPAWSLIDMVTTGKASSQNVPPSLVPPSGPSWVPAQHTVGNWWLQNGWAQPSLQRPCGEPEQTHCV